MDCFMIKIALMGSVDVGKTTFINNFITTPIKEKYGRTETLSFRKGIIGSTPVQFVDCPGHSNLGFSKSYGVLVADLVIHLSTKGRVEKIPDYGKPTLVVINRWKNKLSLAETCRDPKESNRLSVELSSNIECLDDRVGPFMDDFSIPVFPLDLLGGWGINEFKKYFTHLISRLNLVTRTYLVATQPNRYELVGPTQPDPRVFRKSPLGYYEPKSRRDDLVLNPNGDPVHPTFKLKMDPMLWGQNPPELILWAECQQKLSSLRELLPDARVFRGGLGSFSSLKCNETKVSWGPKVDGISGDSFYEVLDLLIQLRENIGRETQKKKVKELECLYYGNLLSQYVFKHTKDELVCGICCVKGVTRVGPIEIHGPNFSCDGLIVELQKNSKKVNQLNPGEQCSVKIKLESPVVDLINLKYRVKGFKDKSIALSENDLVKDHVATWNQI